MFLKEILTLLENKISPKLFKLDSEIYGLQYGNKNEKSLIKKVLITLDLSLEAIHYAIKQKVNLIISKRGLVNRPIRYFNNILISKLTLLSKYPISIFVLNSSFFAAEDGVCDTIINALYFNMETTFNAKNRNGIAIPIGRICTPRTYPHENKYLKLEDILNRIKSNLDMEIINYVGSLNSIIKKICIVGPEHSNTKFLEKAIKNQCDCYISGRLNHNDAIFARDAKMCVIEIPSYRKEIIAMKQLKNILSLEFPYDNFLFFDSKDPFKSYL